MFHPILKATESRRWLVLEFYLFLWGVEKKEIVGARNGREMLDEPFKVALTGDIHKTC